MSKAESADLVEIWLAAWTGPWALSLRELAAATLLSRCALEPPLDAALPPALQQLLAAVREAPERCGLHAAVRASGWWETVGGPMTLPAEVLAPLRKCALRRDDAAELLGARRTWGRAMAHTLESSASSARCLLAEDLSWWWQLHGDEHPESVMLVDAAERWAERWPRLCILWCSW